jgi:hypothetical protein
MNQEEKQKRFISLNKTVQDLKDNQKLVMGVLTSETDNGLTDKDLKVVKWAYNQKFKMLQHEKQVLLKKSN